MSKKTIRESFAFHSRIFALKRKRLPAKLGSFTHYWRRLQSFLYVANHVILASFGSAGVLARIGGGRGRPRSQ